MPPQQVIDQVVSLEKELAVFYSNLPQEPGLAALATICQFMAKHSFIHAELIANYRSDAAVPQLQTNPLGTLHDRLRSELKSELANADTIHDAMEKLAVAEAILGQAYVKIADHYDRVSSTYQKIANKFRTLSQDEQQHCDYIRREQDRLKTAESSTPKPKA